MRHGTCGNAGMEKTENAEGERRLQDSDNAKVTFEDRVIIRWKRNRGYKASAVCEMVAAREAAGV